MWRWCFMTNFGASSSFRRVTREPYLSAVWLHTEIKFNGVPAGFMRLTIPVVQTTCMTAQNIYYLYSEALSRLYSLGVYCNFMLNCHHTLHVASVFAIFTNAVAVEYLHAAKKWKHPLLLVRLWKTITVIELCRMLKKAFVVMFTAILIIN